MMQSANIVDSLKCSTLFRGVDDGSLNCFVDAAQVMQYPKGKILFINEEEASSFYLIVNGWVKLFRETIEGTEAVVDVLTEGHFFGETSVFEHYIHGFSAKCVEDTQLIVLPTRLLKQFVESNTQITLNMLSSLSAHRRQQSREIEHLNIQNAPQRIGCFLLRLCPVNLPPAITLHLPYDKTLIAARIGMKPETFSRALAKLKSATDISINGSTVTIHDVETLVEYTCNHCSYSFPCQDYID